MHVKWPRQGAGPGREGLHLGRGAGQLSSSGPELHQHVGSQALPEDDHPGVPMVQRLQPRMARCTCSVVMSGTAAGLAGPKGTKAGLAGVARGCFCRSLVTTSGLGSRSGGATRAAHARESSPSPAKVRQRRCWASVVGSKASSPAAGRLWGARVRAGGPSSSSSRSPSSQRPHRRMMC